MKLALENGYEIEIIKGYEFNKVYDVFKSFIDKNYKLKSDAPTKAFRNIAKLILNSLIGRFGMNRDKAVTKILSYAQLNLILATRKLKTIEEITPDAFVASYDPAVDPSICNINGVDFVKYLNSLPLKERHSEEGVRRQFSTVSIPIAAAVLSYARIDMLKTKLAILKAGGKIYYADTDSIVTNIKLPDNVVDPKEIGKYKLEFILKEAYFLKDKTYCCVTEDGEVIIKPKGINTSFNSSFNSSLKSSTLCKETFIEMYETQGTTSATKTSATSKYSTGVTITTAPIYLDFENNSKREKVFNEKFYNTDISSYF